jgi:hypothetical protein
MEEGGLMRSRAVAVAVLISGVMTFAGLTGQARAGVPEGSGATAELAELTAELDGKPIPLADVSRYYCDDFSYPLIRCSRIALVADLRAATYSLLASVEYVTVFDQPSYAGAYMHVSQDYSALVFIGWNDKISSFKARNWETGRFWTDWLYTGTIWSFCCNSTQPSLGGYDNTFSSVQRT